MGKMTERARRTESTHRGQAGSDGAPRIAVISLHTSPLDQPGAGDSGGMNVYIGEVAERLAEQGIVVDIYTRCHGSGAPEIQEVGQGTRLIHVQAGPCAPVAKEQLPTHLPRFLDGVLQHAAATDPRPRRHSPYDVVHSHYWLSGWVGDRTKQIWGAPHVASFHTLGRVKNESLAGGDLPEPPVRLDGELDVIRGADRILSPTPSEAAHLVDLYGADPSRIRIVPPGVDSTVFVPGRKDVARRRLHLSNDRLILFVGRLQPLKGPDVAIRALAHAVKTAPGRTGDWILAVVGGSSGPRGVDEVAALMELAANVGVGDRVVFFPPQPHERLADFYSAAEVVLMPSRTESFGLVALEAQSCGTPVIASATGGLRHVVRDGETGFLVKGSDPQGYAERMLAVLGDPALAERLSRAARVHAERFTWETTASGVGEVYRELLNGSTD